jgi:hypothetical protein
VGCSRSDVRKRRDRNVVIEPKSHVDIEAAVRKPDKASLGLFTAASEFKLVIQVKSRSTGPWSARDFARLLKGTKADDAVRSSSTRARPLAILNSDPKCRYVLATNESVQAGLLEQRGDHLLDFPAVAKLPPHARAGFDAAAQASIAPRILVCAGVTVELLDSRISHLLTAQGHVPIATQAACIRDLREAIRNRMTGGAEGQWSKAATRFSRSRPSP